MTAADTSVPDTSVQGRHRVAPRSGLYHRLWRWHFLAGLACVPLIVLLAVTGSVYLFKTEIEGLLERPLHGHVLAGPPAPPSAIVAAAQAAVPGGTVRGYTLPDRPTDAVELTVAAPDGPVAVWVHPGTATVLKVLPQEARFMEIVRTLHGELLLGDRGALVVELAASWAFVLLATGLFLGWPRGQGLWGIVAVRTRAGRRLFWRDLHSVTGIWVSGLALVLLLTGLPWTNVWGDAFQQVRALTGTAAVQQDWSRSRSAEAARNGASTDPAHADHAGHDHPDPLQGPADSLALQAGSRLDWDRALAQATALRFAGPVEVVPPGPRHPAWVVRSQAADRISRATAELDPATGHVLGVEWFADRHPVDQAVGIGIALHEGRLFGPANQIAGLVAALGLVLLSVSGLVMWWQRRPRGRLGVPALPDGHRLGPGALTVAVCLAAFLPLLALSLAVIVALDRLTLPLMARLAQAGGKR